LCYVPMVTLIGIEPIDLLLVGQALNH